MRGNFCELPREIVEQILSWLPARSLLRFKSVSKSWYALINLPTFVAKHVANFMHSTNLISTTVLFQRYFGRYSLKDNETEVSVVFSLLSFRSRDDIVGEQNNKNYVMEDIHIPLPMDLESIKFIGHCDGILCLTDYKKVLLWNPTINECKLLPPEPYHPDPMKPFHDCLISRAQTRGSLGFGCDPISGHYKVVKISYCGLDMYADERLVIYPPRVDVYTLGLDSWRQIKNIGYLQTEKTFFWPYRFLGCFKGFCYWLGGEQQKEFMSVYHKLRKEYIRAFIISFDMNNEVFQTISLPFVTLCYPERNYFGDFHLVQRNETIALCGLHSKWNGFDGCSRFFGIWVMDDCSGGKVSWTKHLTFKPPENTTNSVLSFWKNNEILMTSTDGRFVSYNIGTKELEYIPVHSLNYYGGIAFVNSIVSVTRGNSLESKHD